MSVETQQQPPQTPPEQAKTAEYNFAQIRKQLEEERKARVAAEEKAAQLEKRPSPKDDDDDYSDEPYVDHRKLDKKLAKFEQTFEKKVDEVAERKARQMIEQERQQSFLKQNPDFEQILSPEMLKKFVEKHPEMAEPMLEMPDNFSRQKLLYQNIKALGLHKPPAPEIPIQQKIDQNKRSPYYQPTGGNMPPYQSQGDFSPTGQKAAFAKMQELIKGRKG